MKRYLFPIVWMGVIFTLSTDIGSMGNTSRFLVPLIRFIYPAISRNELALVLMLIRKSAHLFEYGVLSILWFSVLGQGGGRWIRSPALMSFLLAAAYAFVDELHHAFVRSRTGSFTDVGIDAIGALLGLIIWKGLQKLKSSPQKIKARYFGWWFSWGVFSSIMVLIVFKGGRLAFWQMLLVIAAVGIVSGIGGIVYYVRRG
ncbi:MAG: VanZ family protein [Nitrospiria bacterium]